MAKVVFDDFFCILKKNHNQYHMTTGFTMTMKNDDPAEMKYFTSVYQHWMPM